jgi:hypothetical protein
LLFLSFFLFDNYKQQAIGWSESFFLNLAPWD